MAFSYKNALSYSLVEYFPPNGCEQLAPIKLATDYRDIYKIYQKNSRINQV